MTDLVEEVAKCLKQRCGFEDTQWRLPETIARAIIPIVLERAAKEADSLLSGSNDANGRLRNAIIKRIASAIRKLGEE